MTKVETMALPAGNDTTAALDMSEYRLAAHLRRNRLNYFLDFLRNWLTNS